MSSRRSQFRLEFPLVAVVGAVRAGLPGRVVMIAIILINVVGIIPARFADWMT